MIPVTPRQRDVLNYIESYIAKYKVCPSYDDVRKGVNLKSLATVHKHITNLQKRGAIKHSFNGKRTLELVAEAPPPPRFTFEGPHHLWDSVLECYWVRESDVRK